MPPVSTPTAIEVAGSAEDPSVVLLASWLEHSLGTAVEITGPSAGHQDMAGVHGVSLHRSDGTIELRRTGEETIVMNLPGDDTGQHVTMPVRTLSELIAEELRRMDPDEVYGEVLGHAFSGIEDTAVYAAGKPEPSDRIVETKDEIAPAAAESSARQLAEALTRRGVAHLVVTGGSVGTATAAALPEALTEAGADLSGLHIWWGDERFVDPDSSDRNEVGVRETMLNPLREAGLPERNIHPMPSASDGMSLEQAAAWYGQQLDLAGGDEPFRTRGRAFFDVLWLGMGPDGHVASLFPEHPDQRETGASAVPVEDSPKPPPQRISLTWPVLNSARHVAFLVSGADKAEAVVGGHGSIDPWPVPASAVRGLESTTWYMDRDAAGGLPA